ncbi:MAG: hypothetical protein HY360_17200 [Verrucomicrobia bacterium]|nr:hypothetical protein [Verrucomicrobiota bacterium]
MNANFSFAIQNALVRTGEPVRFEIRAAEPAGWSLRIVADALEESPRTERAITLEWQRTAQGMVARVDYTPSRAGHYNAILTGPNGDLAGRYFAAVDGGQAVCHFFINGTNSVDAAGVLTGIFQETYAALVRPACIPFEYHLSRDFSKTTPVELKRHAEIQNRYGHNIVPMMVTRNLGFYERFSMWELSREELTKAIGMLRKLWTESGLGHLEVVNGHWCIGNENVRALREANIRVISAIVVNYEMRDGESREMLTGSPVRPWYAHPEDFRKPGSRTDDYILCLPFSVTLRTEFLRGNVDAHWAPDIQMVWDRSIESAPRAQRSLEILDMLCDQPQGAFPYIFPVALQNFGPPAVIENNRNTIRHLLRKAREGKVVFANAKAIRDFYLRHAPSKPESVEFMRDFMIGSHLINKPIHHPDVIQIESARFNAAFERPNLKPEYLFDYVRKWDYPDEIFRNFDLHGPEKENLNGVKVGVEWQPMADGSSAVVRIESDHRVTDLPVAMWNLPCQPKKVVVARGDCRFVPVTEPQVHTPHGLLVGAVEKGATTWEVRFSGSPSQAPKLLSDYHGLVGFQTILVASGIPYTYVWNNLRINLQLRLRVPRGRRIWMETYEKGDFGHTEEGVLNVELRWPRPWARIWNASAEEILVDNGAELDLIGAEHFERVTRNCPLPSQEGGVKRLREDLWQRRQGTPNPEAVSRLPAFLRDHQNAYIDQRHTQMVAQAREWFDQATAHEKGKEVVAEAYAYAKGHLGGPWRDKADAQNIITCREGIHVEVPVYDYAICHAPGYRAWHMGRAFHLRFKGLAQFKGRKVMVYLHCYDYEGLGRAYSVRLNESYIAGNLWSEVLRTTGPLPVGPEGRDDPRSLIRIPIPLRFLQGDLFDMHVLEGYDAKAIDFRKQVPYSVAVSDVWVTISKPI